MSLCHSCFLIEFHWISLAYFTGILMDLAPLFCHVCHGFDSIVLINLAWIPFHLSIMIPHWISLVHFCRFRHAFCFFLSLRSKFTTDCSSSFYQVHGFYKALISKNSHRFKILLSDKYIHSLT